MIDEYIKDIAAPAISDAAKNTAQAVKDSIRSLYMCIGEWFTDFRWIECCAAVSAAFAAGYAMANSLHLPSDVAKQVGQFGAIIGAICYIRSPKTRWDNTDSEKRPCIDLEKLEAYARGTYSPEN